MGAAAGAVVRSLLPPPPAPEAPPEEIRSAPPEGVLAPEAPPAALALPPLDAAGFDDLVRETLRREGPLERDGVRAAGARTASSPQMPARLVRWVEPSGAPPEAITPPLRVEYTVSPELSRRVLRILERARVELGHVVVMDPASGRIHAYISTAPDRFPPDRTYPAASLMKVVTAAAAMHYAPELVRRPCRFAGSPYRLTRARLREPPMGREVSFESALASSNNQCLARIAVRGVGAEALLGTIARFGLLETPAPGHPPGETRPVRDELDLGRLGCGLAGCRITPLHAVRLAATLADGQLVRPFWVDRVVDARGLELSLPPRGPEARVMTAALALELREMLTATTRKGTARRAFRDRRGRPLLGAIRVAGKTGSLSGRNPDGRYEWFAGVAPAGEPRVALAVVLVQGDLWWRNASQVAASVLEAIFCHRRQCDASRAEALLGTPAPRTASSGPGTGGVPVAGPLHPAAR